MPLTEVSLTLEEGSVCQIFTKAHIVTADDPLDPSGEDEGPTPLEYLLAAVGSSAAIAVQRAAARLDLDIEEIQVHVAWPADHHQLLEPGAELSARPIRREIRVRCARDITEAERDHLLTAAKTAPVSRALAAAPRVEDALYIFGYESDLDSAAPADGE